MRPINKKHFGPEAGKIAIRFHNGTEVVTGYIIKQLGTSKFRVSDGTVTKIVYLAKTPEEAENLTGDKATIVAATYDGTDNVHKLLTKQVSSVSGDSLFWADNTGPKSCVLAKIGASNPKPVPFLVVDYQNDVRTLNGVPITMQEMVGGRTLSTNLEAYRVPGVGLKTVVTNNEAFPTYSATTRFNNEIQDMFEEGFIVVVDFEQNVTGGSSNVSNYSELILSRYSGDVNENGGDVDILQMGSSTSDGVYIISAFHPDYETAQEYDTPAVTLGVPHKMAIQAITGGEYKISIDGTVTGQHGPLANDGGTYPDWFFWLKSDATVGVTVTTILRSLKFYRATTALEIDSLSSLS